MIQRFEGLSLEAYPDAKGWSIGYGHFGAQPGQRITLAEAEALFDQDVARFETVVTRLAGPATQQQFDAMVALAYNIGEGKPGVKDGFSTSTVLREHRARNYAAAADAFALWNKSEGAVNPVLVARRKEEARVYRTGVYPNGARAEPAAPTRSLPAGGLSPVLLAAFVALGTYLLAPRLPMARRLL